MFIREGRKKVLDYCPSTTKHYIEYLNSLDINQEAKGYLLLKSSTDAIVEFYRVCLYKSFGDECEVPYKMRSLEPLIDSCVASLEKDVEAVKRLDELGINKYIYIQGCITLIIKAQSRTEAIFNCRLHA